MSITTGKKMEAALQAELSEPFEPSEIKWKPQSVSGSRALAVAFVDARIIMDRLDRVVGAMNWEDSYEVLPGGSVRCRLSIAIGEKKTTKEDVGSPSEQPDPGDRLKSAFSDAMKRAAIKFGIGRYLYRLRPQWVDYDPQKKQFVGQPRLPEWAVPKKRPKDMPHTGLELRSRLIARDAEMAAARKCQPGELMAAVKRAAHEAGLPEEMLEWDADEIMVAVEAATAFVKNHQGVMAAPSPATVKGGAA